jgi:hypothetical protein
MTDMPNVTIKIAKRDALKWVANQVVSRSVTATISLAIKQNVRPEKKRHVAYIYVGAWALGDMVGEMTEPYVNKTVDESIEHYRQAKAFFDKLTNKN